MDPAVRDEMDALYELLAMFAVETVTKHGEFYPFAGVLAEAGNEIVAAASDEEMPDSTSLLADLEEALRTRAAGGARAVAIAADVRIAGPEGRPIDAIRVHVEHLEGDAVDVFTPYERKRLRGTQFGDAFSAPAERLIFT